MRTIPTHTFVFVLIYWELAAASILFSDRSPFETMLALYVAVMSAVLGVHLAHQARTALAVEYPRGAFLEELGAFVAVLGIWTLFVLWLGESIATPAFMFGIASQGSASLWLESRPKPQRPRNAPPSNSVSAAAA